MKIVKAHTVVPDEKGFYCHMTTREALLVRHLLGHIGSAPGIKDMSEEMRHAMSKAGCSYVGLFDVESKMKFRTDAANRLDDHVLEIEDEDE